MLLVPLFRLGLYHLASHCHPVRQATCVSVDDTGHSGKDPSLMVTLKLTKPGRHGLAASRPIKRRVDRDKDSAGHIWCAN